MPLCEDIALTMKLFKIVVVLADKHLLLFKHVMIDGFSNSPKFIFIILKNQI